MHQYNNFLAARFLFVTHLRIPQQQQIPRKQQHKITKININQSLALLQIQVFTFVYPSILLFMTLLQKLLTSSLAPTGSVQILTDPKALTSASIQQQPHVNIHSTTVV